MILIVDNYDSFVYNVARYFQELGQQVVVKRNDAVGEADLKAKAIVISPGPCTPHEAGESLDIVRKFSGKLPILGVCLGHQCIGEAFGGTAAPNARCMGIRPRSFMTEPGFSKDCPTALMRGAIIL